MLALQPDPRHANCCCIRSQVSRETLTCYMTANSTTEYCSTPHSTTEYCSTPQGPTVDSSNTDRWSHTLQSPSSLTLKHFLWQLLHRPRPNNRRGGGASNLPALSETLGQHSSPDDINDTIQASAAQHANASTCPGACYIVSTELLHPCKCAEDSLT